jgi:hypothetical protein
MSDRLHVTFDQEQWIVDRARGLSPADKEVFHKHVGDILRPLGRVSNQDIAHAISFAFDRLRGST